jgi:hypothetical protein
MKISLEVSPDTVKFLNAPTTVCKWHEKSNYSCVWKFHALCSVKDMNYMLNKEKRFQVIVSGHERDFPT